jgi:hypothetical protein
MGLIAHPHHHAADFVELCIDIGALFVPVLLGLRQLQRQVAALVARLVDIGHRRAVLRLVCHVVQPRAQQHDRLERGVLRYVGDALAVDPDLAAIAQGIEVLRTGSQHGVSSRTSAGNFARPDASLLG